MSLNGQDSGSGSRSRTESFRSGTGSLRSRTESLRSGTESLRSRTESFSSLHSVGSSSNRFDTLSTGDMMVDEFDRDSEYSSFLSQDAFDESSQDWGASSQDWGASSQDWAASSTSSLSFMSLSYASSADEASPPDEASPQNPETITTSKPEEADQSDEGWTVVGVRQKPRSIISEELNKESRGELKCIRKRPYFL